MSVEAPTFGAPQNPEQSSDQTPAEAAAVRPEAFPPAFTPSSAEEIDAKLREYTPQPPLTAAEIAAKRGGQWPSQEDVDGINAARAAGKHLG